MLKYILFSAFIVFGGVQAHACDYTLNPHETLSQVAQRNYPNQRVYGKHGSLAKLLRYNKNIVDPNKVEIGQVIHFLDLSVASGGTSCKAAYAVTKKVHSAKKAEVATTSNQNAPVVHSFVNNEMPVFHKAKVYHHRVVAFSPKGSGRSPASVQEPLYMVPAAVVSATPEVIFQGGLVAHAFFLPLPADD